MTMLYRSQGAAVRDIDSVGRTASFVAATEGGVDTWRGVEVLRMAGADLGRFEANPVVLDTHNREGIDCIIGSATIEPRGRELVATVTFAKTDRAERAWSLVRDGFLRGMSVGYGVDPESVERLREGDADGEGEHRVVGPAYVVNRWELFELSLVPIPADEDALRRSFYTNHAAPEEGRMSDPVPAAKPATPEPETPAKPADPAQRGVDDLLPEELAARSEAAVLEREKQTALRIRALAPAALSDLADELVIEGVSVEEARKRLLDAYRAKSKPGFTPEPTEPPAATRGEGNTPTNDVDALVASFSKES